MVLSLKTRQFTSSSGPLVFCNCTQFCSNIITGHQHQSIVHHLKSDRSSFTLLNALLALISILGGEVGVHTTASQEFVNMLQAIKSHGRPQRLLSLFLPFHPQETSITLFIQSFFLFIHSCSFRFMFSFPCVTCQKRGKLDSLSEYIPFRTKKIRKEEEIKRGKVKLFFDEKKRGGGWG